MPRRAPIDLLQAIAAYELADASTEASQLMIGDRHLLLKSQLKSICIERGPSAWPPSGASITETRILF